MFSYHFRSHVSQGARYCIKGASAFIFLFLQDFRESEVSQLYIAILTVHDVLWLDVTMSYTPGMTVIDGS